MHIHVCVYIYIYIHIHTYIHTYTCIGAGQEDGLKLNGRKSTGTCACINVCCMCACVCACICTYAVYSCANTNIPRATRGSKLAGRAACTAPSSVHMLVSIRWTATQPVHGCMYACMYVFMLICSFPYFEWRPSLHIVCMHACMYAHMLVSIEWRTIQSSGLCVCMYVCMSVCNEGNQAGSPAITYMMCTSYM
jgi:hypothetical protein